MSGLASKSLTAVTSVVSVVREETVIALRCNTRGMEQIVLPLVSIPLMVAAIVFLSVGSALPMWVEVDVFQDPMETGVEIDKGNIEFGLWRGEHDVTARVPSTLENEYDIRDRYEGVPLERIDATFAFIIIAILLALVTIAFTVYNTYHTVESWWRGPHMMYAASLLTSFFAFIAMGLFLDFYNWELDGDEVFTDSTSFEHLLDDFYFTTTRLRLAFGLHVIGSTLPLIVTLFSWRLMVLLPEASKVREISASQSGFEMGETPSQYGGGSRADPMVQATTEKGQVLY